MWVSKQLAQKASKENAPKRMTITGQDAQGYTMQADEEIRGVQLVAPFGMAYAPLPGQKAVMLPLQDAACCLGVWMPEKQLQPGEIMLCAGSGACVYLKADGSVVINGQVFPKEDA